MVDADLEQPIDGFQYRCARRPGGVRPVRGKQTVGLVEKGIGFAVELPGCADHRHVGLAQAINLGGACSRWFFAGLDRRLSEERMRESESAALTGGVGHVRPALEEAGCAQVLRCHPDLAMQDPG